jgi:hypothetical protein
MALSCFATISCFGEKSVVEAFCNMPDPEEFFSHRVYDWKEVYDGCVPTLHTIPLDLTDGERALEIEFRAEPPISLGRLPLKYPGCQWTVKLRLEGVLGDWGHEDDIKKALGNSTGPGGREITGLESVRGKLTMDDENIVARWKIGEQLGLKLVQKLPISDFVSGSQELLFFSDPPVVR